MSEKKPYGTCWSWSDQLALQELKELGFPSVGIFIDSHAVSVGISNIMVDTVTASHVDYASSRPYE